MCNHATERRWRCATKGKSIADVLDMTVNMAVEFFENVPQILPKIKSLQDVGLGYLKLGQSSTTLSGGESQRVKLATELSKRDTGKTLYILDEPTTGLHFDDIRILMDVLQKLVDRGNTVLIIEHNLDVIKLADYIIDMGPEGRQARRTSALHGHARSRGQEQKRFYARLHQECAGKCCAGEGIAEKWNASAWTVDPAEYGKQLEQLLQLVTTYTLRVLYPAAS